MSMAMNINPFINLVNSIISIYTTIFILWIIVGWLIRFQIINPYQQFVKKVMSFCHQIFEPPLQQIRKFLPPVAGIDLSPLVLFLLLNFIKEFLFTYFYRI